MRSAAGDGEPPRPPRLRFDVFSTDDSRAISVSATRVRTSYGIAARISVADLSASGLAVLSIISRTPGPNCASGRATYPSTPSFVVALEIHAANQVEVVGFGEIEVATETCLRDRFNYSSGVEDVGRQVACHGMRLEEGIV